MTKSKRRLIPIFSIVRLWMKTLRRLDHPEILTCVIAAVEKVKLVLFVETSVLKELDQESNTVSNQEALLEVWVEMKQATKILMLSSSHCPIGTLKT